MTELDALVGLLTARRIVALTGAGCSTESGIPDYRSPGRAPRNPIQGPQFCRDPEVRARYWARSLVGWPQMRAARPNPTHHAFASLEATGRLVGLITQNVDRLHHVAGSQRVVELHGALAEVVCLGCGARESRDALQERMHKLNPGFLQHAHAFAPDGDADVSPHADFVVPACEACGGVLKPDVVFFGDSVPRPRVEQAYAWVAAADVLLVAGTSLTVWSGYRFARAAVEAGKPLIILNAGPTRADALATLKIEARLGELLPQVTRNL